LDKKACFKLGYIGKTHGIKGELTLITDIKQDSFFKKLESVFVEIDHQLVPFFITSATYKSKHVLVKFDGIDTIEQAALLKNSSAYLPLSFLPKPDKTSFHFRDIIGFQVIDLIKGQIGILEAVLEFPQQNVLQIISADKTELLIPARLEFVTKIDSANKCLELNTPEGLLDVYLK